MTTQTPPPITLEGDLVAFGRQGLLTLRAALTRDAGDAMAAAFQEAGFAAGDQIYDHLRRWLRTWTGVDEPGQLDAANLNECLGAFFAALGWGPLTVAAVGRAGLTLTSPDWAEAAPGSGDTPTCFFSAGMLTNVMGRLADRDVAVMEVECRSRGDAHCRFLAGSPESVTAAYNAMAAGGSWEGAVS
ncbi:MAG: V4R domain-containing protein [Gemmatimonadales bacterium]